MVHEKFSKMIYHLETILDIESQDEDMYARIRNIESICSTSEMLRIKLNEYTKFMYKMFQVECEAKSLQEDVSDQLLKFIFVAMLRGLFASTTIKDSNGKEISDPKKQHWLPVALIKQFPITKEMAKHRLNTMVPKPQKVKTRAVTLCSVANDNIPMKSVITDTEFIHKKDYYYENIVEYMFSFTEGTYGNAYSKYHSNKKHNASVFERVIFAGFAVMSFIRLPMSDKGFRDGDLETTLKAVFEILEYMKTVHVSIERTPFQLPLMPFNTPYTTTRADGNTVFFYPVGINLGLTLSTKSMYERKRNSRSDVVGHMRTYRNRMVEKAFEKSDIVLGMHDIEEFTRSQND